MTKALTALISFLSGCLVGAWWNARPLHNFQTQAVNKEAVYRAEQELEE